MGKPGRPTCDVDDYLDWQERLESYEASGLSIKKYCVEEGLSRSTFHRWRNRLRDGVPESISAEAADREQMDSDEVDFLPVSLKSPPIEIELPNGGVVRLPLGVGKVVLMEVLGFVAALGE